MNNAKKELLVKPKALKRRQQDSNQRSGSCSPTPYHLAMSPQITICLQIGCSGWKLAKQVVRQNTAFRSLQTKHYCQAPRVGLEPTTLRLTAECSTIELSRIILRCVPRRAPGTSCGLPAVSRTFKTAYTLSKRPAIP